jgi:hypothetical protein
MDKSFTIIRSPSTEWGTFGMMLDGDLPFCVTLERRWLDNKCGESCILDGQYPCRRVNSPRFGNTFEISNVEGRSEILFHKGNIDDDSHGCVILGEQFEPVLGTNGVISSGKAFIEFLSRTKDVNQFILFILWGAL